MFTPFSIVTGVVGVGILSGQVQPRNVNPVLVGVGNVILLLVQFAYKFTVPLQVVVKLVTDCLSL